MQCHLRLGGFPTQDRTSTLNSIVCSFLDEQPLFNAPIPNTIHVFIFSITYKYEKPYHFLSTTNPSDQYKTQNNVFLNYNSIKTNNLYTFDMKYTIDMKLRHYRGEQTKIITKTQQKNQILKIFKSSSCHQR